MKIFLPFLLLLTLLSVRIFASVSLSPVHSAITDTIPPPPPDEPLTITGPGSACVGETSVYTTEVPVACTCLWYINDILQGETSPVFTITWNMQGIHEVALVFQCSGGEMTEPESIFVSVAGDPQPGPIEGATLVCEYATETYSIETGPLDSCQWKVNGVIQPGFNPYINYSFGSEGEYLFEVIAFNHCGTSGTQTLTVTAQGTAPSVYLGNDTTILENQSVILDAGNPGCSYLWSTGAETQTITVYNTGSYWVRVSNFCGQDRDTINVTVLVGINEHQNRKDCPVTGVDDRTIRFLEFPCGPGRLEVYDLAGKMLYNGPEIDEFIVPNPGIYLIRFISRDSISNRKVLVK